MEIYELLRGTGSETHTRIAIFTGGGIRAGTAEAWWHTAISGPPGITFRQGNRKGMGWRTQADARMGGFRCGMEHLTGECFGENFHAGLGCSSLAIVCVGTEFLDDLSMLLTEDRETGSGAPWDDVPGRLRLFCRVFGASVSYEVGLAAKQDFPTGGERLLKQALQKIY